MAGSLTRLNPPAVFAHPNFSRMIVVEAPAKIVWISGQTPQNDDLSCVAPGDYQAQYIDVMEKLALQLASIGATWSNVVFRRTYTRSIAALRAAIAHSTTPDYFADAKPCSTLIGVTELSNPDFLLEVEIMVALTA